jgi:hypothetical protein
LAAILCSLTYVLIDYESRQCDRNNGQTDGNRQITAVLLVFFVLANSCYAFQQDAVYGVTLD